YFTNVGSASGATSNDYSVTTQYYDSVSKIAYQASFGNRTTDGNSYPASGCPQVGGHPCLTDAQLESEIDRVISNASLPRGTQTMYYIFTPPGVITCFDSAGSQCSFGASSANFVYCAYHSSF